MLPVTIGVTDALESLVEFEATFDPLHAGGLALASATISGAVNISPTLYTLPVSVSLVRYLFQADCISPADTPVVVSPPPISYILYFLPGVKRYATAGSMLTVATAVGIAGATVICEPDALVVGVAVPPVPVFK